MGEIIVFALWPLMLFVFSLWALAASWLLYVHALMLKDAVAIAKRHRTAIDTLEKAVVHLINDAATWEKLLSTCVSNVSNLTTCVETMSVQKEAEKPAFCVCGHMLEEHARGDDGRMGCAYLSSKDEWCACAGYQMVSHDE